MGLLPMAVINWELTICKCRHANRKGDDGIYNPYFNFKWLMIHPMSHKNVVFLLKISLLAIPRSLLWNGEKKRGEKIGYCNYDFLNLISDML